MDFRYDDDQQAILVTRGAVQDALVRELLDSLPLRDHGEDAGRIEARQAIGVPGPTGLS